jgi:hypothetical protein
MVLLDVLLVRRGCWRIFRYWFATRLTKLFLQLSSSGAQWLFLFA